MGTPKRIQITLNPESNEVDKSIIEWMESTGFKDASLARNALIYYYRVSNGLPTNMNGMPTRGNGNLMKKLQGNTTESVETPYEQGNPDEEFEKNTKGGLKGLLNIGGKNKNK